MPEWTQERLDEAAGETLGSEDTSFCFSCVVKPEAKLYPYLKKYAQAFEHETLEIRVTSLVEKGREVANGFFFCPVDKSTGSTMKDIKSMAATDIYMLGAVTEDNKDGFQMVGLCKYKEAGFDNACGPKEAPTDMVWAAKQLKESIQHWTE
eukprot:TRINITY_DN67563_c2_g1_i1.p1 TRINITY_DN67563_c2_g1~~TRINITY_DN67563_c2_g1_i1.p1  ORF type:complete len:151 (+),score=26.14 TRINITY_DN67563_c2_g1_i1:11-463(+)